MFQPKEMVFNRLGRTGLIVSQLALGNWLSETDTDFTAMVKLAFDNGVNFYDTAECYGDGSCEIALGEAIKTLKLNRRELVIVTKIHFGTGRKDPNDQGLSRKHIIEGTQDSLARLQLSYVDLCLAHYRPQEVPMEEIVRAFNYLINQGLCFYWGTSGWTAQEIELAHSVADRLGLIGPVVEQCHYSLLHRNMETELEATFKEHGTGIMGWSPLESGILTGKYNDGVPTNSRFNTSSFFTNAGAELLTPAGKIKIAKVKKLGELSSRLQVSQTSLALAWCMKHPNSNTVIIGARTIKQLEENLLALKVLPLLTESVMEEIEVIMK